MTCVKLRPRINFDLRLEPLPRHVFSIKTSSSNTLPLFTQILRSGYTLSLQCDTLLLSPTELKDKKMDKPRRHSFFQYTLTMRLFLVSEKPTVSNHKKKDILNM